MEVLEVLVLPWEVFTEDGGVKHQSCRRFECRGNNALFRYSICINRHLCTDDFIRSIEFNVSIQHVKKLRFRRPICELSAIKAVEDYLSKKITQDYLNEYADDGDTWTFEDYVNRGCCRGFMLGDNVFLEDLKVRGTCVVIETGS
jgi:hypothetical protein